MIYKLIILLIVLVASTCRNYPKYDQCDEKWGGEQLGNSPNHTICTTGSLVTSIAMALSGIGKEYNPSSLNNWLKANNGYISYDLFVWTSVNSQGMVFQGFVGVSQIRASFDLGRVVIVNIKNGSTYALVTGYRLDTIQVNNPLGGAQTYNLTQITDGNVGQYIVPTLRDSQLGNELELANYQVPDVLQTSADKPTMTRQKGWKLHVHPDIRSGAEQIRNI